MTQAVKILEFAMKMEQEAANFYSHSAQYVRRESVRILLLYLAEWERGHYSYLEAHKNSLLDKEQWGEDLSLPLDAREGTHILEKSRKGEGVELPIHACATDLSVLRTALSMEKDFHVFYQNAAEKIQDPEGKKILRELAVWEEGHEEIIQEQLESLREDFMRDMGFEPF